MLPDRYEDDKREYMRYSIFPACAIDDIDVSAECLRVLAALGSYASKRNDYWCWAGLDKIAKRTGVTAPAISQSVNHLATLGYIELHHDFDKTTGKQISNAYRLIMDYVLPPERDRSRHTRPRAGIGGRKKSAANTSDGLTQNKGVGLTQNKGEVNSELRGRLTQSVKGEVNSELTKSEKYESEKLNRENESLRAQATEPVASVINLENEKQKTDGRAETAEAEADPTPYPLPARTAAAIAAAAPDSDLAPAVTTWVLAQEAIKRSMTPAQYQTNIRGAQLFTAAHDHWRYILIATTPYTAEQLRTRFYERVRRAVESVARGPFAGLEVRTAA